MIAVSQEMDRTPKVRRENGDMFFPKRTLQGVKSTLTPFSMRIWVAH
jgi:hypothetical protein